MKYVTNVKNATFGPVRAPLYKLSSVEPQDIEWPELRPENAVNREDAQVNESSIMKHLSAQKAEFTDISGIVCYMVVNIHDDITVDEVKVMNVNSTSYVVELVDSGATIGVYAGVVRFVKVND